MIRGDPSVDPYRGLTEEEYGKLRREKYSDYSGRKV